MMLSLCIATYNEENNIHIPLDSAIDLVDEVIIVDGRSTDKTVEIAKSYGPKVKIYIEDNPPMFHINKQKAIERARGEWILQLDADEELTLELKKEIQEIIQGKSQLPITNFQSNSKSQIQNSKQIENLSDKAGFYIPRKNFFLNRFLKKGGVYPDYTIRLYKNGSVKFPCKNVHENVEIITMKQLSNETIGYLKNPILHYESPTFARYMKRWHRYTAHDAMKLMENKQAPNFFSYLFIKPSVWFFKTYFRHLGLLDGYPGFVFSLFSSLRFWGIYAKWWKRKHIRSNINVISKESDVTSDD